MLLFSSPFFLRICCVEEESVYVLCILGIEKRKKDGIIMMMYTRTVKDVICSLKATIKDDMLCSKGSLKRKL